MTDYTTHDPKGWCGDPKRGAALGRPTIKGEKTYSGRLTLRRVYLNQGGYDPNGTYFGHGDPLYWYASEDGEIDGVVRATGRSGIVPGWRGSARAQVLKLYTNAKVRR